MAMTIASVPPTVSSPNSLGGTRAFDAITDLLIPLCILGMVGSFVNFVLDVRAVHLPDAAVLRHVCGWFLLAVVCISRLLKKYGGAHVAGGYIVMLAASMGLFLAKWSSFSQANLLLNYALFGGAWWAIHRLTDECTVEDDVADEGEAGLLAGMMSGSGAGGRRHPGRLVMLFGLGAVALFAAFQSSLAADPALRQRAFLWMLSTCFFSLTLLTLTSLSGLRLYARQRGTQLPAQVPRTWMTMSLVVVALLLGLSALVPRGNNSALNVAQRWFDRGEVDSSSTDPGGREGPIEGFRRTDNPSRVSGRLGDQPTQQAQPRAGKGREAGQSSQSQATNEGGGTPSQQQAGPTNQPQDTSGGGGQGKQSSSGGGSSGEQQANAAGQSSAQSSTGGGGAGDGQAQSGEGSSAGQSSGQATRLGAGRGASWWWLLLLLLLLYLLYRWAKKNREKIRMWLQSWRLIPEALTEWVRNFACSMADLWARMVACFHRGPAPPPRVRPAAKPKPRVWTNPFADTTLFDTLDPRALARHTYAGVLDYAELIGAPRGDQQTPIDFLRSLPAPLQPHKHELAVVTGLYVQAAYTPNDLATEQVAELRPVWELFGAKMAEALSRRR